MTIFLSIWYHNEIAITLHPETGARTIVAKTRSGPDATLTTTYAAIPAQGAVKLFIKAEPDKYSLGYALGNVEPKYITTVESKWLQAYVQGCVLSFRPITISSDAVGEAGKTLSALTSVCTPQETNFQSSFQRYVMEATETATMS